MGYVRIDTALFRNTVEADGTQGVVMNGQPVRTLQHTKLLEGSQEASLIG